MTPFTQDTHPGETATPLSGVGLDAAVHPRPAAAQGLQRPPAAALGNCPSPAIAPVFAGEGPLDGVTVDADAPVRPARGEVASDATGTSPLSLGRSGDARPSVPSNTEGRATSAPGTESGPPTAAVPGASNGREQWRKALAANEAEKRRRRGKQRAKPGYRPGMTRRLPPDGAA